MDTVEDGAKKDDEKCREIMVRLIPFTVPLMIFPDRCPKPENMLSGGSGALVDTGEKRLLITCSHVWKAYEKALSESEHAVIVAGRGNAKQPVILNGLPVLSRDESLDLVVVDFLDGSRLGNCSKSFFRAPCWPPEPPVKDDVLCVIGFPGLHNIISHGNTARTLHADMVTDFVVSVSDRHMVLADEERVRTQAVYAPGIPQLGPLGGLSGSPAFVNRNSTFDFVGVAYEAGDNTDATIFVSHACYLKANGDIDYGRLPW
jgi:hypothetical protein